MHDKLTDFYSGRKENHSKDSQHENFQKEFNLSLQELEKSLYIDNLKMEHPAFYVFGAPRSGTTLYSQLLSNGIQSAYINNMTARFYRSPLTGMKLFKTLGENNDAVSDYKSVFATTKNPFDIHEFGYFWKHWLLKKKMSDIVRSPELENAIDWPELKKIILNIQNEFSSPFVAKNILAAYHIKKFREIMPMTLFLYIERDAADAAVSILKARKKYYKDLNLWWSYVPLEYDELKDLNYMEQIAGQVCYLQAYYRQQVKQNSNVISVSYEELCINPKAVIKKNEKYCMDQWNYQLKLSSTIPDSFPFSRYSDDLEEKKQFQKLIEIYKNKSGNNL